MKASSLTAVVLVSLAGVAFARPSPQADGPTPACITTCINKVVGTGACTDAGDTECLCSNAALKTCVQSTCPPSFVDALAETCGTGPFSSSSESASSESFTIQTNTLSGATTTSSTSSATTVTATTTSSRAASPAAASTGAAATPAMPAGNAGDLTVSQPGLKGILGMGLAFAGGALLV